MTMKRQQIGIWVNKDKFWEFQQEYNEMQEEQQNPVSVGMHIIVEMKTLADKKSFLKMRSRQ